MTAFKPLGDISRKEIVLRLFEAKGHDEVVSYAEISEALDQPGKQAAQAAVNEAKAALERQQSKALIAIPNTGYRIVRANEHLGLARRHQKRSARQLKFSKSKVAHVDESQLTPGERAACQLALTSISLQMDYMRRNDIRNARQDAAIEAVRVQTDRSADEIAELQRRLAQLEGKDE